MLASVDDLKASALQVRSISVVCNRGRLRKAQLSSFLKRIEALEKEVRHLRLTSIDRDDLDRLTSDTKRLTVRLSPSSCDRK